MVLPLIDLASLLFLIGALIFCILVARIVEALFGVVGSQLGKLPIIGGWFNSTADHISQRITNVMGKAAAGVESAIGWTWHQTARLVDWTGREIERHAALLAALALHAGGAASSVDVRNQVNDVRRLVRALHEQAAAALRAAHAIPGQIARGIGEDVLPRIKSLDREVGRLEHKTIPALRSAERATAKDLESLRTWVHRNVLARGTKAFALAVAGALAYLGLDWIRCNSAKGVFSKRGCGLWNDLDALLGMVAGALIVTDICQIVPLLEDAFGKVAAPLIGALTGVAAGLCRGVSKADPLEVPALHLPASPAVTINLG